MLLVELAIVQERVDKEQGLERKHNDKLYTLGDRRTQCCDRVALG
jgi:hypothetical protein